MRQRKLREPSTRHEQVYHAAPRCQAASLPLTAWRWHGLFKACQIEGQKTGGCFASQESARTARLEVLPLGSGLGVQPLSRCKDAGLIPLFLVPHGKDHPDPHLSQRTHRLGVTFPFLALALRVVLRPGFALRPLPGKLLQGVAQGFDTGIAPVGLRIGAACIGHRRRASQRLQTGAVGRALTIIADLCQQTRSQSLACTGQTAEDLLVLMPQKQARDLLVVGRDLLKQGQQWFDQHLHQARFRARRDRIGHQMRLVEGLEDLRGDWLSCGMPSLFEDKSDLLLGSGQSDFRRGIGLQEEQSRALMQFAEEGQNDGIRGYASGGELVDQARLTLDQTILITGQGFEFLHQRAIGFPSSQISQLGSAMFGQQIGIDLIGFGSRSTPVTIHGLGIDGIDGEAGFQQRGDEQAMGGFDDASHLLFAFGAANGQQKVLQLSESFHTMGHMARSHLATRLIDDQYVMVRISPIYAYKPHRQSSPSFTMIVPEVTSPFTVALEARSSNHRFLRNIGRRSAIFGNRSSRVERRDFHLPRSIVHTSKCTACSGPLSSGLVSSFL